MWKKQREYIGERREAGGTFPGHEKGKGRRFTHFSVKDSKQIPENEVFDSEGREHKGQNILGRKTTKNQ